MPNVNSALLKSYIEREVAFLTSLESNFIMKLEDDCFISGPTSAVKDNHLVIIGELALGNLENFIQYYQGNVPEDIIMNLYS